jgi:hypothetical protein
MRKRKKRPYSAFEDATDSFARVAERVLSPFGKKTGWPNLVKNWLAFLVVAVAVLAAVQSYANYNMAEADQLTSVTGVGCDMFAMLAVLAMPPVEELLFRIGPRRLFGNRAAFVGSMVWAMLHLAGRNFAVAGFQLVMSMFYFKLVAGGRYKECIIFHEAFNLLPLLTCFLF